LNAASETSEIADLEIIRRVQKDLPKGEKSLWQLSEAERSRFLEAKARQLERESEARKGGSR